MIKDLLQRASGVLLTIVIIGSFGPIITAQDERKIVESVDIQGNRRLSDEELLKLVKVRPGRKFVGSEIEKDLRTLLSTGQFDKSSTRVFTEDGVGGGVAVFFEVREMPLVEDIRFKGLRLIRLSEITALLENSKIKLDVGMPYDPIVIRKARIEIQNYVIRRGLYDAVVTIGEEIYDATKVKIEFYINEQPERW